MWESCEFENNDNGAMYAWNLEKRVSEALPKHFNET